MTGALVAVGVNTLAFYVISEILPGFDIKDKKVAVLIAVAYSFLMFLGGLLVLPFAAIVGLGLALVNFIPVIGPIIAGAGMIVTTFIITFVLTLIMLKIIDKMMDSFEMRSPNVAYIASGLLAAFAVLKFMVLGA